MGQQRLRQNLTEFVVDGGTAWGYAVAPAIAPESPEEGTVIGAGMESVQTVDNVKAFLERLQCLDRFRQFGLCQGSAVDHALGDAGLRVESLVLHEEDHSFGSSGKGRSSLGDSREEGGSHGRAETGRHGLKVFPAAYHGEAIVGWDD